MVVGPLITGPSSHRESALGERNDMPTPGGLPKAGDILIDRAGDAHVVIERTSTSAPFSVWVRREDGGVVRGFRSENTRNRGKEGRISVETGRLQDIPGMPWMFYKDWHPQPKSAEAPATGPLSRNPVTMAKAEAERARRIEAAKAEAERQGTYKPMRDIQIVDAHRYKDPKDARYYSEEVEAILAESWGPSQAFVMSKAEAWDLGIKLIQFVRDNP